MSQLCASLLALLFFLSGPVMKGNAEIWHSPLAAKTTVLGENMAQRVIPFAERTGEEAWGLVRRRKNGRQ